MPPDPLVDPVPGVLWEYVKDPRVIANSRSGCMQPKSVEDVHLPVLERLPMQ
jgi:hypothetical protein